MSVESDRRQRGRLIRQATGVLEAKRLNAENDANQHDVTRPRYVLTEVIPQSSFYDQWQTHAKKAGIAVGAGAAVTVLAKYTYTDPKTGEFDAVQAAKSLGGVLSFGGMEGLHGVAGITLRHHRELTHQSVELSGLMQRWIDLEQRSLGVGSITQWKILLFSPFIVCIML